MNLGNPRGGQPASWLLCLWLAASLACSLIQMGPREAGPAVTPIPAPSRPAGLVETPAQADQVRPVGRIFYVAGDDPDASDSNNGLFPTYQGGQDGPWQTIRHAAEVMAAGDGTYVRAGTYYESGITFRHSGEPDAPILLSRYESEEAILDGAQAEADGLPGLFFTEGRSHIAIQGFTIRNMPWSGIGMDPETDRLYADIVIRDCILHDNGWSGIDLAAVDGFVVEGVESYGNRFYGLNIGASDDGALSSANGVVRNSVFHDNTDEEGHGLAINQGHDIAVSDSVAYHNTIHGFDASDWPKHGGLSYNLTFERNFSYDNGKVGFAINSDSHHVVYRNNVAWRNGADWAYPYSQPGFMCYGGCWHVEWDNNVALENTGPGFLITDELGANSPEQPEDNLLILKNNIAFANGRPDWDVRAALIVQGHDTWQVEATHNNWGGEPGPVVGINVAADEWPYLFEEEAGTYTTADINAGLFQTGNVSVDPEFVDPEAPDVRLRPGSPMIDAGVDVGLPYCGAAPDMGAVEVCP